MVPEGTEVVEGWWFMSGHASSVGAVRSEFRYRDENPKEGMETFLLNLSNPSADATIARATLQITIKDND